MIEQLRRASSNGIAGFGHCGQRLIFNIDRFGGIAGAGQGLGDDQGDRLTDMAYLADCQRRPRRIVPWRAVTIGERGDAGQIAKAIGANVLAGGDEQHAWDPPRPSRIDALDVRMRQRRTHHDGMRHLRQGDIVGVAR